jgi:O-6-methylguanine DNA methyltransferase
MHQALLLIRKIPKGKVATYGEVARICGTSPRAIGRIMANNKSPEDYPCYKVVASDGDICGYSGEGGILTKVNLLRKDGIVVQKGRVSKDYFYTF